jgi:two-component system nitrogen regulation sensor histidine kinase GlnL
LVFTNLLDNAADAMDGQGEIIISGSASDFWVNITVSDNGPGIPPELKDKIFYPLVSGRPDGHGLGLTLAQDFISQHHGMIEFSSEPGKTCFTVLLPI